MYAIDKATPEGKATIIALAVVSLLSWTVIISKIRQLWRASKMSKKFFAANRATRDPADLFRKNEQCDASPAFEIYLTSPQELLYLPKNKPLEAKSPTQLTPASPAASQCVHS